MRTRLQPTVFYEITLGPTYNEHPLATNSFLWNDTGSCLHWVRLQRVIMRRLLCIKLIDCNWLPTSAYYKKFPLHLLLCKRDTVYLNDICNWQLVNRGFPKVDNLGIDNRIVLEQKKSAKKATSDRMCWDYCKSGNDMCLKRHTVQNSLQCVLKLSGKFQFSSLSLHILLGLVICI